MKHWRTTTRPNGEPGTREHVWGWDMIGAVLAVIVAVVGSTWHVSARLASVESKLESARDVSLDAKLAVEAVRDDLARKWADAQGTHAGFLTRDEFYRYMAPEVRRTKEIR